MFVLPWLSVFALCVMVVHCVTGLTPKYQNHRGRNIFSLYQRDELENSFDENHFPGWEQISDFSKKFNVTYRQVETWFSNRRRKEKLIDKEEIEENRPRRVFRNLQYQQLEDEFEKNPYPDLIGKRELATRLGLTENRINTWFKNKRYRLRKAAEFVNNSTLTPVYPLPSTIGYQQLNDPYLTPLQKKMLEQAYERTKKYYLRTDTKILLARKFNLTFEIVQLWLKKKRRKQKWQEGGNRSAVYVYIPRNYTFFTKDQMNQMEDLFQENQYPSASSKKKLTERLGLSMRRVEDWFCNRRRHFHWREHISTTRKYSYLLYSQFKKLEAMYQAHPYPTRYMKQELARELNLSIDKVQTWFMTKRNKAKKEKALYLKHATADSDRSM